MALAVNRVVKIKVRPEDFIVRERARIRYVSGGKYRIYLLTKRSWNTIDALKLVARQSQVPMSEISYAGRKDRHALTFQFISVPRHLELNVDQPNVELSFQGYSDEPVSPDLLEGNYFEITLRSIQASHRELLSQRLEEVCDHGFPNYYDDQRFGSVESADEFFAEKLILGHYRGALKLYFTTLFPGYKKEERERRLRIRQNWGKWSEVARDCRGEVETKIVQILMNGTNKKNMVRAIESIPKDELTMFLSAYQSYIWNNTLKNLLPAYCTELYERPGKIMTYLFYRRLPPESFRELRAMNIPTVSARLPGVPPQVRAALLKVLEERKVELSWFNLRDIRKCFFGSFLRPAIVIPENLYSGKFEPDELYPGYFKLRVKFFLPAGSFATMLIKALTIGG